MLSLVVVCGCDLVEGDPATTSSVNGKSEYVLKFSAIPDQNKTELKEKFDAIARHLADKLQVEVEYVPSSDYKASVETFRSGDVQLAWFGGLTGVQARHAVSGARAIAQGKSDPNFKSYFIAHKSTDLKRSDEFPTGLADCTFTFGSESSTSGRLMPEYFIRQNTEKAPADFFAARPIYSGSHDKTIELVESGSLQSGVVNFLVYDKRVADGKTNADDCRIIWVTPEYADYNFTAHPKLNEMFGEGFIDRLQQTLIEMDDPALLAAFPREALIEAKNEDFIGIEKVARELGFLR